MAWSVNLEAEQILFHEGEQSLSMYLLEEGQLVISKKDGDEHVILGYIQKGEIVGELSFLDQKPRSATVRAVTSCKLIQIPHKTIEDVFKSQPPWLEVFIKTIVGRLRETNKRIKI